MKGVNKAIIIGNVGRKPETKTTDAGLMILKMSIATERKYKDKEETTWHNIKAFGKAAEILAKYVHQGDKIYIEGRIDNRSYEKDGQKRYISEIIVEEFLFLGGKEPKGEQRTPSDARSDLKKISEGLKASGIDNAVEATTEDPFDDGIPY